MNALRKFLALSWEERFLLLEAYYYLGWARFTLLRVPFKQIAPRLGRQLKKEEIPSQNVPPTELATQVGWAVDVMSHRTPWESACLAQTMAGKFMLRRRGVSSLLYLGTKKDEFGEFVAHAWLQSGNKILLGGGGAQTFVVLSTFGEKKGSAQ